MSFVHLKEDLAECKLGNVSTIRQFVVILEGATIGENCNIFAHCLVEGRSLKIMFLKMLWLQIILPKLLGFSIHDSLFIFSKYQVKI
jgi:hypothetical protein